ncbi:MAG: hypothetical protein MR842_02690 [Clostridiales bacterium]|nr:hypothetical protein [Clostridiales bacterium]MDO4349054.1 dipicolinate synthase subunit DpsA [Eubacteriales bacterium]MDY4009546.1 dipicolinate synthase subunit DpsA [Candidatus Limiplasma sp.]
MIRKILVVGGDRRALLMAPMLAGAGYEVRTLGLAAGDEKQADIAGADALLMPYPFAVRDGNVPTLTGLTLHPGDVLECAGNGTAVLAGQGLEPYIAAEKALGKKLGLAYYTSHEPFVQKNAELSAEAALFEAMGRSQRALMDQAVLVTGYGRFGRALALRLRAVGAKVWVAARREAARLLAGEEGMHPIMPEEIAEVAPELGMVLNTVPAPIIDTQALKALPKGAWLLELASAPYGFNRDEARRLDLKSDVLPGLPAKYACESAALALKEAAMRLLVEAAL